MIDKLRSVEAKYDELTVQLGTSELQADQAEYRKAAQTLSDLEPLVNKFREYKRLETEIAGAEELVRTGDAEMRELAQEELAARTAQRDRVVEELKLLLIP